MADLFPRYRLSLTEPPPDPLTSLFGAPVSAVAMEIGFGGGEHLLHYADSHPATGVIGAEPFVNGMAKAVLGLDEGNLHNVRLYDGDAIPLLHWCPDASLADIFLLYPDPWPKRRHRKRRFVNSETLDQISRILQPGGHFWVASDVEDYVSWTLHLVSRHGALQWTAKNARDWRESWDGWPGTRFEARAIREGRTPTYMKFLKD